MQKHINDKCNSTSNSKLVAECVSYWPVLEFNLTH